MDTFEELLEAVESYSDAKAVYKAASEKVRYDVRYFCAREYQVLIAAKKRLKEALDKYVVEAASMRELG